MTGHMNRVALLRGINVGGNRKIPMADLRLALQKAGFEQVQTYIQSGNILWQSQAKPEVLARQVQQVVRDRFGFEVEVVVRTAEQWQHTIQSNPFPDQTDHLHVAFLGRAPSEARVQALQEAATGDDLWHLLGEDVYLFYPHGTAEAQLTHKVLEKHLQVSGTVRNWRTVLKVQQLLEQPC